ncbi:MAG: CBS domain-containing protein [Syntrophobacteraceae bacterium]|nr:CBS domain-containing protein [Syntrophobacteraceae bacterium]
MEQKVMQLMRRGAITCPEETTVLEVAQIMVVNKIGYCVVTNQKHEVRGIISARSILRAFGKDMESIRAKDIVLPYTITITPSSRLGEAIDLMNRKKIEHLIVVSDRPGSRAILGVLCANDIVDKMAKTGCQP